MGTRGCHPPGKLLVPRVSSGASSPLPGCTWRIRLRLDRDGGREPGTERPAPRHRPQAPAAHRHPRPRQLQPRRHLPPAPTALRTPLPRPAGQNQRLHRPPALQGAQEDPHAAPGQQHAA
ncbi:mitochondrial ribosomal protein L55 [Columba livia]|uniref:Mitochondrial ribosomal protein L55 n=1 Tax=Columba livia TaxID=8932 RepID=A0A2I0MRA0_COLLI|nr:mitochondrial ribosomal protein L55 [Columba livia]